MDEDCERQGSLSRAVEADRREVRSLGELKKKGGLTQD